MVVRLKDIAGELGVSVPLVSKVLNNSQGTIGVSEKTAALIRETARRMGYVRNRSAASLTQGRQNAFALLMHFSGVPGSRNTEDVLEGVSSSARKYDQHLELAFFKTDGDFENALRTMTSSRVDGLVLAGARHPNILPQVLEAGRAGLPIVTLYNGSIHEDIANVACDQKEVCRMATAHLYEKGCRRIACISMLDDRFEGYTEALQQLGIDYDPALVFHTESSQVMRFDRGIDAVEKFLADGVQFDGIVAHCDLHAVGALHALRDKGINVPQDVKVIGVDNTVFARESHPPLTSISESLRTQAEAAVDMLMDAVAGKPIASLTVAPELVQRAST